MIAFNEIVVDCPSCDTEVVFRSTSGDCSLSRYHFSRCPIEDVPSIEGSMAQCPDCGFIIEISVVYVNI